MSFKQPCFLSSLRHIKLSLFLIGLLSVFSVSATLNISDALLTQIKNKYGQEAFVRIEQWQQLIDTAKNLPEKEKLVQVNQFFNQRIEFIADIYLWSVNDYWATPLEFLSKGAGDCEDFSIAKYFTLLEVGVAEEKMRLTYVKAVKLNQAHMVLTYFPSPRAIPLVLDNLIPQIKPANQRTDLLPVYSFNGTGLWLAKARGLGKKVGKASRLNMWNELKNRMLSNTF